jgi:hypothetical protein
MPVITQLGIISACMLELQRSWALEQSALMFAAFLLFEVDQPQATVVVSGGC